jgi:hypothetical protein
VKTRLQLRFRVWGRAVNPTVLTSATAVTPTRAFEVGEARGKASRQVAGWEWHSGWGDRDAEPLLAEFVRVFESHTAVFRKAVDAGADASLTIVGEVLGDLVSSQEEADAKGWFNGEGADFRPFIADDRPIIDLDLAVLHVLVEMNAQLNTHLDFDLDDG